MESRKLLLISVSVIGLVFLGFLALILTPDHVDPLPRNDEKVECSKVIRLIEQGKPVNYTAKIPEVCNASELKRLGLNPEEGDKLRNTRKGIKIVE